MITRESTKVDHTMKLIYVTTYHSDHKVKLTTYSFDDLKNLITDISKFSYDLNNKQ
jgi:hypothetical protein